MPIEHNPTSHAMNEKLQNKIQEHFDQEMNLKRKIFDIEMQHDAVGQQIYKSLVDLKAAEDKAVRDRLAAFKQSQRDMMSKIESLQIEYNGLYSKRSALLEEINSERRDSMNYLLTVYKKLEYMIVIILSLLFGIIIFKRKTWNFNTEKRSRITS